MTARGYIYDTTDGACLACIDDHTDVIDATIRDGQKIATVREGNLYGFLAAFDDHAAGRNVRSSRSRPGSGPAMAIARISARRPDSKSDNSATCDNRSSCVGGIQPSLPGRPTRSSVLPGLTRPCRFPGSRQCRAPGGHGQTSPGWQTGRQRRRRCTVAAAAVRGWPMALR